MAAKVRRKADDEMTVNGVCWSRAFVVWRYIYTIVLMLLAAPFIIGNNTEVGSEPGVLLLVFGVLPSTAYLIALRRRWPHVYVVAYVHGSLLIVGSLILLVTLPNYFVFLFLAPLAGFVVEWIVATITMVRRSRRQT